MIDVRQLPLAEGRVLIPFERVARPCDFRPAAAVRMPNRCPFCAGNETETPDALTARPADGPWEVRVIPNKFPALSPLSPLDAFDPVTTRLSTIPLFFGQHEVVIESPRHITRFSELDPRQVEYTLQAYRDRIAAHRVDLRLVYSLVFRNCGADAGASLEHVHSQIMATRWVPANVATEIRYLRRWRKRCGRCLLCDLLEHEIRDGRRLVAESAHFAAWCPYASRFAYETWIMPKQHLAAFDEQPDGMLRELGPLLQEVAGRIERLPGGTGYNFWLHTSPFTGRGRRPLEGGFHWHLELMPRVTQQAGFEWGGGDYINPVAPEQAAATLRDLA